MFHHVFGSYEFPGRITIDYFVDGKKMLPPLFVLSIDFVSERNVFFFIFYRNFQSKHRDNSYRFAGILKFQCSCKCSFSTIPRRSIPKNLAFFTQSEYRLVPFRSSNEPCTPKKLEESPATSLCPLHFTRFNLGSFSCPFL